MKFRLLLDYPRSGTLNMAIDELLMEDQQRSDALPVLRIYTWSEDCRTLGYFQSIVEQAKRLPNEKLVRRLTGGGLVRHGQDVTFSLILKENNPFFPRDVKTSYLKINEAVRHGLRAYAKELEYADCKTVPTIGQKNRHSDSRVCFEAPACYDLLLRGKKVVGASQRRKNGVLLHQSSLLLGLRREEVFQGIVEGFHEKWKIEFSEDFLSPAELERAHEKEISRYSSAEWASPIVTTSVAARN